ncbi:MAG: hypothetical protein CBD66_004120 [Flavobacteriaceae bacterium TMED206]|nr:MAG: hypothetical protein CBD66_004120 [Flavobacteriaceae bacterium TMED206]|tara:strand:+ start:1797 stop:3158 length:1362 start_codon:yes stop_codon:yes gene_type:complete
MNTKVNPDYLFVNDMLQYKSLSSELTNKNFKELDSVAKKAKLKEKIDELICGEIVNKSENQAALHSSYRSSHTSEGDSNHLIAAEIKVEEFLNSSCNFCIAKGFDSINIINLGIGGSFEGPKLLLESINNPIEAKKISKPIKINFDFITGSDPSEFYYKTNFLKPENTFFIVSSKSFNTDETIVNLKKAFKWSGNISKFIAITANPDEAKRHGIKNIMSFDKEIGGRYSIWSPITQFHLYGKKRSAFLKGGHQADIDIIENKDYLNFVKRLSFTDIIMNSKGRNVRTILSYIWHLRSLPSYFQQLEMESLGKHSNQNSSYKNTGQIIFGGYGPTAQHSYFQLLHQGTQNLCADIISTLEDKKSLAFAQAITQSELLAHGESETQLKNESKINGNVPVNLFLFKKFDAFNLGYLIATWEYRTFVTATILGINPFDQFGVNAGKIYTKKYLANND